MNLHLLKKTASFIMLLTGVVNFSLGMAASVFPNFYTKTLSFCDEFWNFSGTGLFTLGFLEIIYGLLFFNYKIDHWGVYLLFLILNGKAIFKMKSALSDLTSPGYFIFFLIQLIVIAAFHIADIAYNKQETLTA